MRSRLVRQPAVQRPDLREDGRVGRARVPKMQHPLHDRKIAIHDGDTADAETRFRVGVGERGLGPVGVEVALAAHELPGFEQVGGSFASVGEGKGQLRRDSRVRGACCEPGSDPLAGRGHFRRRHRGGQRRLRREEQ